MIANIGIKLKLESSFFFLTHQVWRERTQRWHRIRSPEPLLYVPALSSALQGPQGLDGVAGVSGAPGEKVRRVFPCH